MPGSSPGMTGAFCGPRKEALRTHQLQSLQTANDNAVVVVARSEATIAVGTLIAERPPHRTVRAAFPHTLPPDLDCGTRVDAKLRHASTVTFSWNDTFKLLGEFYLGERLRKLWQARLHLRIHFSEAGRDNDGKFRPLFFDRIDKLQTCHVWHGVVGDNQINRAALPQDIERLLAGRCCDSGMAKIIQHGDGIRQNEYVVVYCQDNERGLIHHWMVGLPLASTDCRSLPFCNWQPKLGSRPFALSASQIKPSSGLLGDTVHHGQPQSGTFAGSLGGKERLHRAPQRGLIHSFTGIPH